MGGLVWWKNNSKMANGRHFEKRYIAIIEKSSDFDEILYTAPDLELDERHVITKSLSHPRALKIIRNETFE